MTGMNVHTVRKANLRRLVAQEGSIKAFAEKVGSDAAYVSSLLSDNIDRNPGRSFMKSVEKAYSLGDGTLDFPEGKSLELALEIQALPDQARQEVADYTAYIKGRLGAVTQKKKKAG